MSLENLINIINDTARSDFLTAKKYIEENMHVLQDKAILLDRNARAIFNLLMNQKQYGIEPLSKEEMSIVKRINQYADDLNIRGIQLTLNNYPNLLKNENAVNHLSESARIILEGMGVIKNQ